MKTVMFMIALFVVVISAPAQTDEPAGNIAGFNSETDIRTDYGSMVRTGDKYTVALTGVSMRKAVDLLVDNSIKSRVPRQEFDGIVIKWDGTDYTINTEDGVVFTSGDVADVRKWIKARVKLVLDNL
jgi:hypothetical protein